MQPLAVEEIIGRDSELEQGEQFLERAVTGQEALVLEGEAGIGKTALWRVGLRSAEARGIAAMTSRPGELETALSYLALRDLLEDRIEEVAGMLPAASIRAFERAFVDPTTDGAPVDQRAVCTAFLEGVRALARSKPVLIAIDDCQWLDSASTRVLAFAVRRLLREPVSFLFAMRRLRGRSLAIESSFREARVQRLRIDPLDEGAIDRLLGVRLGAVFRRPTL